MGKIFIGRHHEGVEAPGFLSAPGHRADDIVGFVAIEDQNRDFEGCTELFDFGNGGREFLGHCFPLCLVVWVEFMARGRCRGIEGHREVGRLLFFYDGEQGIGKSVDGRGVKPLGIGNGVPDEGKMSSIDQSHAIEEEKSGVGHVREGFLAARKGHGEKKNCVF